MAKTKISEFSSTPANNTDIDSINIAEGCAPSGINDAIRELMAQLKDFQTGAAGDSFNGPVGTTTAAAGAFTTLAASGAVTLSGGTANGVAYLNGSKVLTTGSALVFDGTNLGIGTSSPNYLATLYKASLPILQLANSTSGSTASDGLLVYLNGANATISNEESGSLNFQTSGTLRATLDSSGNLGLGVTPSAWGLSGLSAMQIRNAGFYGYDATEVGVAGNAYYGSSAWRYIGTGASQRYTAVNGQHIWYIAPSGTAGNAISFTQAMTLDASGNLALGTTTIDGRFVVSRSDGDSVVARVKSPNSTSGATIGYSDGNSSGGFQVRAGAIGTAFGIWTADTERARIDSSGNLLVGKTAVNNSSTGVYIAGGGNADHGMINVARPPNTTMIQIVNSSGNTVVGQISQNGTNTTYSTSSDYRLKNTIAPMTGALAKVALLKPCTYKWNADGSDGEGFIAHELQEVVPACVTGEKDAVDADGNPKYQGIDTSFLVATLTAAIQELKAEFDAYKASHP